MAGYRVRKSAAIWAMVFAVGTLAAMVTRTFVEGPMQALFTPLAMLMLVGLVLTLVFARRARTG